MCTGLAMWGPKMSLFIYWNIMTDYRGHFTGAGTNSGLAVIPADIGTPRKAGEKVHTSTKARTYLEAYITHTYT